MQRLYFNGEFITLENQKVEALLIEDDKIKKVGNLEEILKLANKNTEKVNLKRKNYDASIYRFT